MQLMQVQLNEKKKNLDNLSAEMDIKEKKLNELQAILDNKDKQVNDLKNKITDALLGFKDKGLTINTRNGKVYVSMDEKLLFASGSWNVAEDGKTALRNVAKVLELNPEINVMIEGHTDNVPYNGAGQVRDNWDLSVLRATSIVKIILENKGIEAGDADGAPYGKAHMLATACERIVAAEMGIGSCDSWKSYDDELSAT